MSETAAVHPNNANDKIAVLMKEAESLKAKLEEERAKLNDVSCKFSQISYFWIFLMVYFI